MLVREETMSMAAEQSRLQKAEVFIQNTVTWIDTVQRNKIIAAVLLLYQGLNFIIHPNRAMEGMVRSVALTVALAAAVSAGGCLAAKPKGAAVWRSLGVSVGVIALCAYCYFKPHALSVYLRYVIALTAIYTGIVNAAHILRLDKLERFTTALEQKAHTTLRGLAHTIQEQESIESSVEEVIDNHVKNRLDPTLQIVNRFSVSRLASLIVSVLTTCLGVLLMVFPFETNSVLMIVSGVTMILGTLSDLWLAWKMKKARN